MNRYTPTQLAYDTALTALYQRYNNLSNREEKKAIAKLHNKLLDKSGLDGLHIGEQA